MSNKLVRIEESCMRGAATALDVTKHAEASISWILDTGIVQEANRLFFHPLGLCMTASEAHGVQLFYMEADGVHFGISEMPEEQRLEFEEKARRVQDMKEDMAVIRKDVLGGLYISEPVRKRTGSIEEQRRKAWDAGYCPVDCEHLTKGAYGLPHCSHDDTALNESRYHDLAWRGKDCSLDADEQQ